MVKKKIGCFITGGWTEAGAMTAFLTKINSNFEYIQCFPNKPKHKRGLDGRFNGLAGEALIKEVYRRVEQNKDKDFYAIIIEDDLDCRYHNKSPVEIEEDKNQIQQEIWERIGKNIPIIFLFASPEIETWFICDWDNSFVHVYKDRFFCFHLKKYINEKIIMEYWQNGIENYGMRDGHYTKLSDSLQNAVATGVKEELLRMYPSGPIPGTVQPIIDNRDLFYSKKIHGDQMLRNIIPDNFVEQCNIYFKPAFLNLRNLNI